MRKQRSFRDKQEKRQDKRQGRDKRKFRHERQPRVEGQPKQEQAEFQGSYSWLGGFHSVLETLKTRGRSVKDMMVEHELKHDDLGEIVRRARAAGARILFVGRRELDRAVPNGRHQGIAVKVASIASAGFDAFLESLSDEAKKGCVLVALDQIQDPHNLGAIARSAVNLGARALLVPERRSSPVTPAAVQASAGAIQRIPVITVGNLGEALRRCKDAGFWVYGADAAGKTGWETSLNLPLVLVIGSEGYGMRPLTRSLCDELVSIPQSAAGVASLNASCAASVLLYEIARQKAAAAPESRPAA